MQRIWTDDEIKALNSTMILMRRMRKSATSQDSNLLKGRVFLDNVLGGSKKLIDPQKTIRDANVLGKLAGNLYGSVIANRGNRKGNFSNLTEYLRALNEPYSHFQMASHSGADLYNAVGDSMIGRMRCLSIDPNDLLTWELTRNNDLGEQTLEEVIDSNLGIVAPLSGDFILASIYSKYLELTREKSLEVVPVILSEGLKKPVFYLDDFGELAFQDKERIGIYIDTKESGATSEAIFDFLSDRYDGTNVKIVEPNHEFNDFEPGERIKNVLGINGFY